MISKLNHSWRRRFAAGAALVITAALTFLVAAARPDAGNPINGTIKANIVGQTATTVTVAVKGEWNWLSHNADCNYDRAATGAGLAWGDRNGAQSATTINAINRKTNVVTLTVSPAFAATQLPNVGDRIMIAGLTGAAAAFNTTTPVILTSAGATTLKYTQTGADIATGNGGGAGRVWDIDIFNGWEVYKSSTSNGWIGTQFNNTQNPIDREVHPVDRGNIPADGNGPLPGALVANGAPVNQARFDPGMNAATGLSNNYLTWKGGCGREPVFPQVAITGATDNASKVVTLTLASPGSAGFTVGDSITVSGLTPTGYNGTWTVTAKPTSSTLTFTSATASMAAGTGANAKVVDNTQPANAQQTGPGCLEWCGDPWGSWGYDTFDSGSYTFGFTHTYLKQIPDPLHPGGAPISGLPDKICVNFYDVHGGGTTASAFQLVQAAKEVQVDGNGDNSIQTNAFNISEGANCTSIIGSALATNATNATLAQPGNPIHDTATLNIPAGAGGTITFNLYGPSATPNCSGSAIFTTGTASPVNGPGNYDSNNYIPTQAGKYYWTADYSGDPANSVLSATSGCGADNETSTVSPANPSVITNASPGAQLGGTPITLTDSATLSGGVNPVGTMTFQLFGPDIACTGSPIFTNTVTVSGNGTYLPSIGYTLPNNGTTVAGTYRWIANYHSTNGDNSDTANGCNGANENTVITRANPSIVTSQSLIPQDNVTVTGSGAGTPTGSVTFKLYKDDNTCSGSPVYTESGTLNASGKAKTTNVGNPTGYTATGNHTWYWKVNYLGDASNQPSASNCVERFTIQNS